MAKAKKQKPVEEQKIEVPEQPTSLTEPVTETPIEETKVEEPVIEEKTEEVIIPETVFEKEPIATAELELPSHTIEVKGEQTMEEKIVAFLDSREGTDIKLNDFLKSLFGVPKFNEPPNWLSQGASKQLRVLLGDMQTKGLISISNNMHTKLGTFYYEGNSPVTLYHSLNTVPLVAKK